jgi:hypothetical protein
LYESAVYHRGSASDNAVTTLRLSKVYLDFGKTDLLLTAFRNLFHTDEPIYRKYFKNPNDEESPFIRLDDLTTRSASKGTETHSDPSSHAGSGGARSSDVLAELGATATAAVKPLGDSLQSLLSEPSCADAAAGTYTRCKGLVEGLLKLAVEELFPQAGSDADVVRFVEFLRRLAANLQRRNLN